MESFYYSYLLKSYDRKNKCLISGLSCDYKKTLPYFVADVKEKYPDVDVVECTVIKNDEDSFRREYVDIFTLWKADDEVLAVV
ncbi:hypothetical protein [Bacillus vallismortis]|uniref:hypothetical protein n=1 Tax=Bacillus vallismortis TaxID=72361 RepID=UPI00227F47B8|nr:hypothetical protein [Bacillus vallismortis]MCY7919368.1 hypothetical protein [Bacillus vallismortis]